MVIYFFLVPQKPEILLEYIKLVNNISKSHQHLEDNLPYHPFHFRFPVPYSLQGIVLSAHLRPSTIGSGSGATFQIVLQLLRSIQLHSEYDMLTQISKDNSRLPLGYAPLSRCRDPGAIATAESVAVGHHRRVYLSGEYFLSP